MKDGLINGKEHELKQLLQKTNHDAARDEELKSYQAGVVRRELILYGIIVLTSILVASLAICISNYQD